MAYDPEKIRRLSKGPSTRVNRFEGLYPSDLSQKPFEPTHPPPSRYQPPTQQPKLATGLNDVVERVAQPQPISEGEQPRKAVGVQPTQPPPSGSMYSAGDPQVAVEEAEAKVAERQPMVRTRGQMRAPSAGYEARPSVAPEAITNIAGTALSEFMKSAREGLGAPPAMLGLSQMGEAEAAERGKRFPAPMHPMLTAPGDVSALSAEELKAAGRGTFDATRLMLEPEAGTPVARLEKRFDDPKGGGLKAVGMGASFAGIAANPVFRYGSMPLMGRLSQASARVMLGSKVLKQTQFVGALEYMAAISRGQTKAQAGKLAQRAAASELKAVAPGLGTIKKGVSELIGALGGGGLYGAMAVVPEKGESSEAFVKRSLTGGVEGAVGFALFHLGIRGFTVLARQVFGGKPDLPIAKFVQAIRSKMQKGEPFSKEEAKFIKAVIDKAREAGIDLGKVTVKEPKPPRKEPKAALPEAPTPKAKAKPRAAAPAPAETKPAPAKGRRPTTTEPVLAERDEGLLIKAFESGSGKDAEIAALTTMRALIEEGAPGGVTSPAKGEERKRFPSTYPNWFRDRGYSKKEVIAAIDKRLAGKPLTENQYLVLTTLMDGFIKDSVEPMVDHYEREIEGVEGEERRAIEEEGEVEGDIEFVPPGKEKPPAKPSAPKAVAPKPEKPKPPAPKKEPARPAPWQMLPQEYSDYEAGVMGQPKKPVSERGIEWWLGQVATARAEGKVIPKRVWNEYNQLVQEREVDDIQAEAEQEMAGPPPPPAPEKPPKRAPPDRSARIMRGAHGPVVVEFPDASHKELFSAIGRFRKRLSGKPAIDPGWKWLAAHFGVTDKEIGTLAGDYKDAVMAAVKGLEEDSIYQAPSVPQKKQKKPVTPQITPPTAVAKPSKKPAPEVAAPKKETAPVPTKPATEARAKDKFPRRVFATLNEAKSFAKKLRAVKDYDTVKTTPARIPGTKQIAYLVTWREKSPRSPERSPLYTPEVGSRDALRQLESGTSLELDNGWSLKRRSDGLIEIHGATLENTNRGKDITRHTAKYNSLKSFFYLDPKQENLVKFLDQFPLKGQGAGQASKELRASEAGFVKAGVVVPDLSRFRNLNTAIDALREGFSKPIAPEAGTPKGGNPEGDIILPVEDRPTGRQAVWIRELKGSVGEKAANDAFHAFRRTLTAHEYLKSQLEKRQKKWFNGISVEERGELFEVAMSIRRNSRTGKLEFGAIQPAGTLEIKGRVKPRAVSDIYGIDLPLDKAIEGGRLPGDLLIGGRLEGTAEIQLYKVISAEKARLAYYPLIERNPRAKEWLDEYTALQEELQTDPIGMGLHVPPKSREVAKEFYGINVSQPPEYAHVPSIKEYKMFPGKLRGLLTRRPSPHRKRSRGILLATGKYVRNIDRASMDEMQSLLREEVHNKIVGDLFELVMEPLPQGETPKPGYEEFTRGSLKNPQRFVAFLKRNQAEFNERGIPVQDLIGLAMQAGGKRYQAPKFIIKQLQNLWAAPDYSTDLRTRAIQKSAEALTRGTLGMILLNFLIRPSTSMRNFASNNIMYAAKTLIDLYEGLFQMIPGARYSELPFAQFISDIEAPFMSMRKEVREALPREILGKTFASQFGQGILSKTLKITGFEGGDILFKRIVFESVIEASARMKYSNFQRTGRWPKDGPLPWGQFLKQFRKNIPPEVERIAWKQADLYGSMDYWNIGPTLEWWTKSRGGRSVVPYPKYFYKLGGTYRDLFGYRNYQILWGSGYSKQKRVRAAAKIAAGLTILHVIWNFIPSSGEDLPEEIQEDMLPPHLRVRGRIKLPWLKTTRGEDYWVRVLDLPILGDLIYMKSIAKGRADVFQYVSDRLALGPLVGVLGPMFGLVDEYDKHKTKGQIYGETISDFVPFKSYLEYVRKNIDPQKRGYAKSTDSFISAFWHGFRSGIPGFSAGLPHRREKKWPYRRIRYDPEEEFFKFWILNVRKVDPRKRRAAIRKVKGRQLMRTNPALRKFLSGYRQPGIGP